MKKNQEQPKNEKKAVAMADDELDNVAGGCGGDTPAAPTPAPAPTPKPQQVGVNIDSANPICPKCGGVIERLVINTVFCDDIGVYDKCFCKGCGREYRHHWIGDKWTTKELT